MDIIRQELNFNFISSLTQDILSHFDSLKLTDLNTGKTIKGIDSINLLNSYYSILIVHSKDGNNHGIKIVNGYISSYNSKLIKCLNNIILLKEQIDNSNIPPDIKIIKLDMLTDFINDILLDEVNRLKTMNTDFLKESIINQLGELFVAFDNSIKSHF